MKKLIIAAAMVLVAVGFTADSKEQIANTPAKTSVSNAHQSDVKALEGTSTSKEVASWD